MGSLEIYQVIIILWDIFSFILDYLESLQVRKSHFFS